MSTPFQQINSEDLRADAIRFCDSPAAYFGHSYANSQKISREQLDALQLEALKYRFNDLKDKIPMLQRLANKQGIERIERTEDVVPLLFEHTMYKSYPPMLLEKNRFTDINRFISRLTAIDLSGVDVSHCQSIDDWLDVMDKETELHILLSSGTSGVMSFIPASKRELTKSMQQIAAAVRETVGEDTELVCIYPYFRHGAGHVRANDFVVKYIVGDEEHFIAAYPEPQRLSADALYLAGRIRAAKTRGNLDSLSIEPTMMSRLKNLEELQKDMPAHLSEFFERIANELRGKNIFIIATWNLLHNFASQGLAMGEEAVFSPNSFIQYSGGAKGMVPPKNWKEDVRRFFGVDTLHTGYGMTELNTFHRACKHGYHHFSPAAIPFLLDPDTSELLPRKGRVTGRAAFFDLGSETRWGGFITGDEITVNWDTPCSCGAQSYYIEGAIERLSDKKGGDDKISCAATENAHKEAMDFLTNFE